MITKKSLLASTIFVFTILNMSCLKKKDMPSDATNASKYSNQGGGQNDGNSPDIANFLKLAAAVKAREPELEREKDRQGKLITNLTHGIRRGCLSTIPVKTIEITVTGTELNATDVSDGKDIKETDNKGIKFIFKFSSSNPAKALTATNDESQQQLFGSSEQKIFEFPDNTTFTIGDFQEIIIEKVAASYTTKDLCELLYKNNKKQCPYSKIRVKETDRFGLLGLNIKINGLLMYSNQSIKQAFAAHLGPATEEEGYIASLSWTDNQVGLNETFVKAMAQTTNCDAYK